MRILFVHSIGKCKFGGGEKWVISLAAGLKARGHDVVVGGRRNSCLLQAARAAGMDTVNFNILSDLSPYHVIRIARFMRRHQTDVVITRGTDLAITGLAARLAANGLVSRLAAAGKEARLDASGMADRLERKPVVLVRQGLPLMNRIRKHLFLMRKFADGIITNTHSIRKLYESRNWVPEGFTKVVYNGAEVYGGGEDGARGSEGRRSGMIAGPGGNGEGGQTGEGATPGGSANGGGNALSERFPGKTVVLAVGRLARQKGYCYLIDAISRVKEKRTDLVLLILGSGKLHQSLRAHARKRGVEHMIHFEGFVRDVSPYMAGCDLFVLTSLYEGMPNAAMEAMAHGKPVIITDVNGAGELIPDPGKGLLIPPRCPESIADSMIRLLDNPGLRHEMGREAQAHVAENFPVEAMVKEMEAYLLDMVNKKSGGSG